MPKTTNINVNKINGFKILKIKYFFNTPILKTKESKNTLITYLFGFIPVFIRFRFCVTRRRNLSDYKLSISTIVGIC